MPAMADERRFDADLTPLPPSPTTTGIAHRSDLDVGEGGTSSLVRSASIDGAKLALARRFRRDATPAEAAAWALLRDRAILGLKFRRQQILRGFIADFFCASLRLVLELDGAVHDDPSYAARDVHRAAGFEAIGLRVVRVRNEDVCREHLETILARIAVLPPLPRRDVEGGEDGGRGRGGLGG
jgi:very-short-patch-repair endonuclease